MTVACAFQNKKLKQQLEEERNKNELAEKYASPKPSRLNGPDMEMYEANSKYIANNLPHCGLVTPYGNTDLVHHWLR